MKTLFIYNPNAGQKLIKNHLWDIINILSKEYSDLNVYVSQKQKDIINYIKENGNKYDLVIVSGGDGSLSEAVNGLMNLDNKPKLGYIPAGSTNDYAASLKLPKEMDKCTKLIADHRDLKQIDVGKFNNDYFIYVAAFGVFTEVAYSTPQDIKNMLGHFAYFLNGITSLSKINTYNLKITADGKTYDGEYLFGMITNSYIVAGFYSLNNKNVKLDDGLFEVMLIHAPKDLFELSMITTYLLNPKSKTSLVETFKAKELTIVTDKDMPWTLDGEYGGKPKEVTITNLNKALTLVK